MKVRLPRVAAASEAPASGPDGALRGTGVILIAEDEDLVRAQLDRILKGAGYTVLQANNGMRALELFRAHQPKIDLVILDVVMPELDGWNSFLAMKELMPDLKVLFTTGYAANVLPEDFSSSRARILSKPYKPKRLLAQVQELLTQCART
jgi:two-component system cell cycle sensor histidine kinase/response regulator CckA